jgi:serine/threonine protein kinase
MAPENRPGANDNPTVPVSTLVGQTLAGRYKIEALLGEGGMGAVYLAQHTAIKKRVALKLLHADTSQNPELVARFEREAVAAANIDHPNVTAATDFGRAESGQFFLVLEYLEGRRLRDALSDGPMPPLRALHIIEQVAQALERTHEIGIIHRDLKPENIMMVARQGDPDFVKVLDFGLAKVVPAGANPNGGPKEGLSAGKLITQTGSIFGTPRYMAPEQCIGGATDGRSDLYALGLVLYEMLAGVHPITAKSTLQVISHQLATPTPSFKSVAPNVDVPEVLQTLVMQLTEKAPENRPASATALLATLKQIRAQLTGVTEARSGEVSSPVGAAVSSSGKSAIDAKTPSTPGVAVVPAGSVASKTPAPTPAASVGGSAPSSTPSPVPASPTPSAAGPGSAPSPGATALAELLEQLPAPLRARPYLLAVPLALSLFITVWLLRSGDPKPSVRRPTTVATAPAGTAASDSERQQAFAQGIPALLALHEKYPADATLQRTIAMALLAQQQGLESLRWLAKASTARPGLIGPGEVQQAALIALSTADTIDPTVELLETGFGSVGVDVLYALSVRPGPGKVKTRVKASLSKPAVRAQASPAIQIAIDLRSAESCDEKKALLPRAAQAGDARLLPHLKSLQSPHNCGPLGMLDCWACLRGDDALKTTIAGLASK